MKGNKSLYFLIAILVIAVIGLSGYIVYDKVLYAKNDGVNELRGNDTNKETSIKLDSNKEYVYDANYEYDNKYESKYESNYPFNVSSEDDYKCDSTTSKSNEIVFENGHIYNVIATMEKYSSCFNYLAVPYININSSDAIKVNNSINELYLEYAEKFNNSIDDYIANGGDGRHMDSLVLTYNYYQYDNILSILIITGSQYSAPWDYKYKTYNFDLTNGELLSYSEVLDKLGYDKDSVKEKVHNAIEEEIGDHTYNDTILGTAYDSFNILESQDAVSFIVDNNGLLTIVANVLHYVGSSWSDSLYTISK